MHDWLQQKYSSPIQVAVLNKDLLLCERNYKSSQDELLGQKEGISNVSVKNLYRKKTMKFCQQSKLFNKLCSAEPIK